MLFLGQVDRKLLQEIASTESTDLVLATQVFWYISSLKLVTESTSLVRSSLLFLGQVHSKYLQDIASRVPTECWIHNPHCTDCFTQAGCRAYQPSPFNSLLSLGQRDKKYYKKNNKILATGLIQASCCPNSLVTEKQGSTRPPEEQQGLTSVPRKKSSTGLAEDSYEAFCP